MPALIPGLTSGIYGGKNKYVAIFRFCDILTYPAYFKYVVQNVLTWSNKSNIFDLEYIELPVRVRFSDLAKIF